MFRHWASEVPLKRWTTSDCICCTGTVACHLFEQVQILHTISLQLQSDARERFRHAETVSRINQRLASAAEREPGIRPGSDGLPANEAVHSGDPGFQRINHNRCAALSTSGVPP